MATPLHVVACGLCSPLGLDRRATVLEVAARADAIAEHDSSDDRGRPIRASALELLAAGASRTQRMCELAAAAFDELIVAAEALAIRELPMLLALPEPDGGAAWQIDPLWQTLVVRADAHGLRITPARHPRLAPEGVQRLGAAGLFVLLEAAAELFEGSQVEHLVIGAVDSRCDPTSLIELARAERTIDAGPEGYVPGEGAGFLLLTRRVGALPIRLRPFTIVATTTANEPEPFAQREPSRSVGLTRALQQLRDRLNPGARIDHALSCQWDAGYWGGELARAYVRNPSLFPEPFTIDAITETLGVPGAAAPMLQLGVAMHLASSLAARNFEPARVLVYGCAEAGSVGACVLEAGPETSLFEPAEAAALPAALLIHPRRDRFEAGRLVDHLELVGSLLVERFDDLRYPPGPWPEIERIEERIRARVWACSGRGGDVRTLTRALLDHHDPSVELAAGYLLIGSGLPEDRDDVVRRMLLVDEGDELAIWRSAIAHALHGQDASVLAPLLTSPRPAIQAAALDMFDELELRPYELLIGILAADEVDPEVADRALGLLARSGADRAVEFVEAMWLADPEDANALELLLALGRRDALDHLRLIVAGGGMPSADLLEVWALASGTRDAGIFADLADLVASAAPPELERAHLWALSSHGSTSAVPALLAALEHPSLRRDAAIGLERILGAGFIELTWLPDEDAVDPTREGETRLRIIEDPDRWRDFWATHQGDFRWDRRHRLGVPLDHRARVEELGLPSALPAMRRQAIRELAADIGVPLYFGFNWPIAVQHEAIARLLHWLEAATA
jgi:3-oxoacyl-[acyl-carrier-protein] synthase-1